MNDKIFDTIKKYLVDNFLAEEHEVNLEFNFSSRADDLDIVELMIFLETEFSIFIEDDVFLKQDSVQDLVNYVSSKLEKK